MKKIVVVKIGSKITTDSDGGLNKKNILKIITQIEEAKKQGRKIILVSSGAVSAGRKFKELQGNFRIKAEAKDKKTAREQVLASVGQPDLISFYKKNFSKKNIICAQLLVTAGDFAERKRYLNLRNTVENLLSLDILPIFNENDVISDEALKFSDNDHLACLTAAMTTAEKLIILSDIQGVYENFGTSDQKLLKEINDIQEVFEKTGSEKNESGRGGMKSKLASADLTVSLGVPMYIANGFEGNNLSKILAGENPGTFFPARKNSDAPIKKWLKSSAKPKGKIYVSTFLADLLANKKTASIMMLGIEKVEKIFDKDDCVEIFNLEGEKLAKGISRFNSTEIEKQIKQKSKNIAVHYDKMIFV